MSASHEDRDGKIYLGRKATEEEIRILEEKFDYQISQDELESKANLEQIARLRKVCLYKILIFIPEYLVMWLLFDRSYRREKKKITKLYLAFYRKKISLQAFGKQLNSLLKSGRIL